jgi:hypothetical protein
MAYTKKTTKKGNVRKGAKMAGSRLAFDDTKQEKMKMKKKGTVKKGGWIAHVKAYAKKHGIKYGEALKKASASYKKK